MAWKIQNGVLKRLREMRGMSVTKLAAKAKISDTQIRSYESDRPPSEVRPENAEAVSTALGLGKLLTWEEWPDADRWIEWNDPEGTTKIEGGDGREVSPFGTLAARARKERKLKLHGKKVVMPSGKSVELLSLTNLECLLTAPKKYDGCEFAIVGKVDQQTSLPSSTAKVLGADPDDGAVFRLHRWVTKGLPLYMTVFATSAAVRDHLMDRYELPEQVTLVVRVVFNPPKAPWRGFFFFEKPPKARKFALVVCEIVRQATKEKIGDGLLAENRDAPVSRESVPAP